MNSETKLQPAAVALPVDTFPEVAAFEEWVRTAKPGYRRVYHTGFLCHDRSYQVWVGRHAETLYNEPTHSLGLAAKKAYFFGDVLLVQRRLATDVFQYEAVKTTRRSRK